MRSPAFVLTWVALVGHGIAGVSVEILASRLGVLDFFSVGFHVGAGLAPALLTCAGLLPSSGSRSRPPATSIWPTPWC